MADFGCETTPISRDEALRLGLSRYFTGRPCKHGHICERYSRGMICVTCSEVNRKAWATKNPDRWKQLKSKAHRRYYENNAERILEKSHRRYRNNKRAIIAQTKEREKRMRDLIAVLRDEMPDLLREAGL